jgi:predicted HTH domain antitoxin
MQITIEIPDELACQFTTNATSLSQHILETLVVEAYQAERITSAEVGQILNLPSRFAVDAFLKSHKAYLHYTKDDLDQDITTLQQLRNQQLRSQYP